MSTAVASVWTCPQCQRRVPRREPRCHCGYARGDDALPAPAADPARGSGGDVGRQVLIAAILAVCIVGLLVFMVVLQETRRSGVEPARGEARYPALPAVPEKARPSPRRSARPVAAAPNITEVLEVSLRRIAADASVLELSYRPFAEACLTDASDNWLASLKTARLRAGIALRDHGATVDCETARKSLVARADALKSDLAATETHARTSGLTPGPWRALLAKYQLDAWDRY
jgi:hypothetical protein